MDFEQRFTFFEVFAGKGRVSEYWPLASIICTCNEGSRMIVRMYELRADQGHNVASYDRLYGAPMDFTSSAGFAILCCSHCRLIPRLCTSPASEASFVCGTL